ncbi:spheroidene monooxygenase [Sulfitobacter aestuariivivens]|uniref:Spheroidene monooxygenase n=1 Tax=Sulfitobacter aestuariivivens TaxID=2766981 RepID=A0A927HFK1_9RHOB|nr:spheroidene monooxygenase [Sulfitobacter aestuariivivens]MBD3665021.1 spheroidene monooxygenase [Sulfitobacter aestuariivivens]
MPQVVSLSFFRFDTPAARLWAFAMMGLARRGMSRVPGIGFWKLCGSGTGEGFTPKPNLSVYAILATWPDLETAKSTIAEATVFEKYRRRSGENWTIYMNTASVRGAWSGQAPFEVGTTRKEGPVAALTRATIRPGILGRFWGRVPDISAMIGKDPNVIFKAGIGEVPWLHQVTFSIWPDTQTMNGFARTGPHAEAISAVRSEGWFREELYARFSLLSEEGSWGGTSPLARLDAS